MMSSTPDTAHSELIRSGFCVWITGLPCAGKSTLASGLAEYLTSVDQRVTLFDGDVVRKQLSSDLGFSKADREENVKRVAMLAHQTVMAGGVAICALVSPYRSGRAHAREIIGRDMFAEVYVDTPLEVCETRDPKGLYRAARQGRLTHFTGVDDPYEPPEQPDFMVRGDADSETNVASLAQFVLAKLGASV